MPLKATSSSFNYSEIDTKTIRTLDLKLTLSDLKLGSSTLSELLLFWNFYETFRHCDLSKLIVELDYLH